MSITYLFFNTIFSLVFSKKFLLKPYWTMWYIEALIAYRFLLIFINKLKSKTKNNMCLFINILNIIFIILSSFVAITWPTYNMPDYKLIKIMMYLPAFFIGYNFSKEALYKLRNFLTTKLKGKIITYIILAICICLFVFFYKNISIRVLYVNSHYNEVKLSYEKLAFVRLLLYFMGFGIGVNLLKHVSTKKLKVLSYMGENTLAIFILHTFVLQAIRTLIKSKVFTVPREYEIPYVIILFVFTLLLTSNKYVVNVFNKISDFIKNISEKIDKK